MMIMKAIMVGIVVEVFKRILQFNYKSECHGKVDDYRARVNLKRFGSVLKKQIYQKYLTTIYQIHHRYNMKI